MAAFLSGTHGDRGAPDRSSSRKRKKTERERHQTLVLKREGLSTSCRQRVLKRQAVERDAHVHKHGAYFVPTGENCFLPKIHLSESCLLRLSGVHSVVWFG